MSRKIRLALAYGGFFALFLAVGLEPLGWIFYELSHITGVEFLYIFYSIFRGGAYLLSLQESRWIYCMFGGIFVAVITLTLSLRFGR